MKKAHHLTSLLLAVVLTFSLLTVSASATVGGFTDVDPTSDYCFALARLSSSGVIQGTSATTFNPDAAVTTAQLATLLGRIAGVAVDNTATAEGLTVDGWSNGSMIWARSVGIISTEPQYAVLTTEQINAVIAAYCANASIETVPTVSGTTRGDLLPAMDILHSAGFSTEFLPPFLVEMFTPTVPDIREGVTHIACIGDSITWGAGVMMPAMDFSSTYPTLLEQELGEGYQVLNYGMSGRTLLKRSDDPYTEENFYEISHEANADIYVIMLGTNDSKPYNWNAERYREELEAFVRSYMELPNNPKIYLMTPPKAFVVDGAEAVGYDIQDDVIQNEVAPIVKEVAKLLDVNLIDMFAATENHPEWFPDGVHPGADGNLEFAKIVASHLNLD